MYFISVKRKELVQQKYHRSLAHQFLIFYELYFLSVSVKDPSQMEEHKREP